MSSLSDRSAGRILYIVQIKQMGRFNTRWKWIQYVTFRKPWLFRQNKHESKWKRIWRWSLARSETVDVVLKAKTAAAYSWGKSLYSDTLTSVFRLSVITQLLSVIFVLRLHLLSLKTKKTLAQKQNNTKQKKKKKTHSAWVICASRVLMTFFHFPSSEGFWIFLGYFCLGLALILTTNTSPSMSSSAVNIVNEISFLPLLTYRILSSNVSS